MRPKSYQELGSLRPSFILDFGVTPHFNKEKKILPINWTFDGLLTPVRGPVDAESTQNDIDTVIERDKAFAHPLGALGVS